MAYAACWGDYRNREGCTSPDITTPGSGSTTAAFTSHGIHSNRRLTFTKVVILIFSSFYFFTVTNK